LIFFASLHDLCLLKLSKVTCLGVLCFLFVSLRFFFFYNRILFLLLLSSLQLSSPQLFLSVIVVVVGAEGSFFSSFLSSVFVGYLSPVLGAAVAGLLASSFFFSTTYVTPPAFSLSFKDLAIGSSSSFSIYVFLDVNGAAF